MKARYANVVFFEVILLIILFISVKGSVWNEYSIQALPIACETPKVILQQGTAGTSTIFTNSTSAKVSVSSPVIFEYGRAFKSSNTRISTTSGTPVDDSEAILSVTLARDSYIFIIYNAGNKHGSMEDYRGKGCAINVDGVDVAFSWQSPYGSNYANSVTVVYATSLTAGSHVIKGRFFANSAGATVGVDGRQIVAFWFPNVVAEYVRSQVKVTTKSTTPVDDTQAILTFTLGESCVAFIIYNAGNKYGSTEPAEGKGVSINVDGTDISTRQWQSPYTSNYANSITIAYATSLAVGSHTIKGRLFSNKAGSTTTIDERQLIVFSFPSNLIQYDFVQSTSSVSTSSGTPVDDTQAILSGTLTKDSDVLMMYVGGNPHGTTEDYRGKGVQLQIDATDKSNSASWQSPYSTNYADSVTSLWYEQVGSGSHTLKGRFFANYPGYTVTISHRQLLVLAFPKPATYDYVLKFANQIADLWKVRLGAYDQSNIGRLSNCTIYFYDGGGVSRQIYILNGAYSQQFGNWYDLTSFSIVYVAMTVSATSTGTSYVYVYLEVLVPGISTYNLMVITFEIT